MKYNIIAQVRQRGAIGVFYPATFQVTATSPEEARERFLDRIRNGVGAVARYEFNSIQKVEEAQ